MLSIGDDDESKLYGSRKCIYKFSVRKSSGKREEDEDEKRSSLANNIDSITKCES